MIDLTGGNLTLLLIGELRQVVMKHPRFKNVDGEAVLSFADQITYRDVELTIGAAHADGNPQAPDNFLGTACGRVIPAKLSGKDGKFLEWVVERGNTATPATYYLAVDSINEETREVSLVQQVSRWHRGGLSNAYGSLVHYSKDLPVGVVVPVDETIDYVDNGYSLSILTYTDSLALKRKDTDEVLTPGTDWWVERVVEEKLGVMDGNPFVYVGVPDETFLLSLFDGDGELRPGVDWTWAGAGSVRVAAWIPEGSDVYAQCVRKVVPVGDNYVHPENTITLTLDSGEVVIPGGTTYSTVSGDYDTSELIPVEGGYILKHLLAPGTSLTWELRSSGEQTLRTVKKMSVTRNFLPGIDVAFGDCAEPGDQLALIISPTRRETYHIFGGKDSVGFEISVKANDLLTASELASLVRAHLAVNARHRLEGMGLCIQRISTSAQASARDSSGRALTHTVVLSVSASADWEVHRPLVNAIEDIDTSDMVSVVRDKDLLPLSGAASFGRFSLNYT